MSAPQEVSLKVSIVRQGEVVETRRRVLVQPSYEVVAQVAAEYARGKYRLQYLDDDSDWITMSTQEEWQDCLALCGTAQPLRLRIELLGAGRAADTSRSTRMHMWPHMAAWWGRNARGHQLQEQQTQCRPQEGHNGSDCTAWRGCRVRAWHMPSRSHSDVDPAAAAAAGDKCASCDFATTGVVPLYCCRACKLGKGHHGRRCMQQVFCAQDTQQQVAAAEEAADTKVVEAVEAPQVEAEACAAEQADVQESSDAETQRTRGQRRRHGHKAAGVAGVGEKCTNCNFATTGVVESFCCRACQRGRGWHGKRCMQQPHAAAAADVTSDKPYAAEVAQLEEMGFTVTPDMEHALAAAHGNVAAVLSTLLL